MFRFLLTIGSFACIVGMYVLYDRVVVPLMLPEGKRSVVFDEQSDGEHNDELEPYLSLFQPDSWERDPKANIQKIETDQAVILFQTDTVEGNVVKLEPCTILLLDKSSELSPEERIRQAVVMRTPQYAEIEFDGEVSFSRFPFPNIKSGKLLGKVWIDSDMKEPGPQDNLHLETENVVFTESPALTTISTLKDVFFRWGINSGEGSVLRIDLARADPKSKASPKELKRLQFDSLRRLNMFLPEKNDSMVLAAAPPKPAIPAPRTESRIPPLPPQQPLPPLAADSTRQMSIPLDGVATLDIQCRREFVFVPGETKGDWIASFWGNVLAVRTNSDGSSDQITGEELRIVFSPKKPDPSVKSEPNTKTTVEKKGSNVGLGSMEPILFTVRGKMGFDNQPPEPARLTSKRNGGVVMVGDQLQYDLEKNQFYLETEKVAGASKEVFLFLQDNRYVFRSTQGFFYTMDPNGGIGKLTSSSPGNLQGTMGEGPERKNISATWNALQMEPDKFDPKQMVVQMDGGVLFEMQGFGKMKAEKFILWCFVTQGTGATPLKAKSPKGEPDSLSALGNGSLTPDRAMVLGKVHFENENGTCDVNRMDIFFETVAVNGVIERSRWTPQILYETAPESPNGLFVMENIFPFEKMNSSVVSPNRLAGSLKQTIQPVQYLEPQGFSRPPQPSPATAQSPVANKGVLPLTNPSPLRPSPAPANGLVPKTESGGLLGFRSGTGRSAYAITGDRLRMLVQTIEGRSEPSIIHLDGNVRITEQLIGGSAGEAIEIFGEEIKVWEPSTPNTKILIKGKAPKDAEFRGKGVKLNAMEINIRRAENLIWSDGPGRLLALVPAQGGSPNVVVNQGNGKSNLTPLTPFGANQSGGDSRLLVDWNDQMSFNGKTLVFRGKPDQSGIRVRALYQNTQIFADVMMVHLNRLVSFFDDQSDIQAKAESIECAKNVYIRTEEVENNQRKAVNIGEFDGVRVYVETGDFVAAGPGYIRSTSLSDGKGFSVPGSAAPKPAPTAKGETTQLYVRFHKSIRGNYLTSIVEITGNVECMHCPVTSWDAKLGIEDQNAVTKRGYLMNCEKLLIVQMPDPGAETRSVEMTATGRTTIEGPDNLYAGAETIKYNQAKSQVIFDGEAYGKATVYSGKNRIKNSAKKLEYNLETGTVQVLDAEGLEIGR